MLLAVALAPGGIVSRAPALADGELAVSVGEPDDSAFPDVAFVLTADRDGKLIADLRADQVRVMEGGAPAPVSSVRRARDNGIPLGLVVTVDTSGSMLGASIEQARAAADALVRRLAPGDAVGVVAFSDHARVEQSFAADHALAARAIAGLTASGNTALYDGVAESVRLAAQSNLPRRAVVLLSDGREFGGASSLGREESIERAARAGAIFYMIGVGPDIDAAYLEEVASRTGGQFFRASGAGDVGPVYAALEEMLRAQFVVTARSAAPASGDRRQLDVSVVTPQGEGHRTRSYFSRRPAAATSLLDPPLVVATPAAVASPVALEEPPDPSRSVVASWVTVDLGVRVATGGAALALAWLLAVRVLARRRRRRGRRPVQLHALRRGHAPEPVRVVAASAPTGGAIVRLISGARPGAAFALPPGRAVLGTAEDCTLRFEGGNGIAAHHAQVTWRGGRAVVRHLAPGFETRVNGRLVEIAPLDAGYEIVLGTSVVLRFELATDGAARPNGRPRVA